MEAQERGIGSNRKLKLSLDEVLRRAAKTPALIYNDRKFTAFLVPELSVFLHLVATHLKKTSKSTNSKIPYSKKSPDRGTAAYEAIKAAQDLEAPFGVGELKKYGEVVREVLDQFEQRKIQKIANRCFSEIVVKEGIKGWNYTDIQEKKFGFWKRELPTSNLKPRPIWWKLFKNSNAVVLFGRGMLQPIRGSNIQNMFTCTSWNVVPEGEHLLLSNICDLRNPTSGFCDPDGKHPTRLMLTANLAWTRPVNSRLFEVDCTLGDVAILCKGEEKGISWLQASGFLPRPGILETEGSVLSADKPNASDDHLCRYSRAPRAVHIPTLSTVLELSCVMFFVAMLWEITRSEPSGFLILLDSA